ncbi:hypothetical protein UFOVP223_99 [uncultured Caudovirales phage]|uniref:Uncharacterized protein n=1 Tax=uncultured Caudovirales phage TaxID=2100421 RepID=A0A6J7WS38_9CAUD|nr:hypothetical protein UFOVP110_65 [uncultured Caudovirales phage]CAB5219595.1 hypothetical protein UFOVP223_99 [uncultured Caudovirales phage]
MTFLLSEDKALREKLQGMVVYDQRAENDDTPRPVGVFFGQPDQEIRSQTYPYVTIDMVDIQRDTQREMRGVGPAAAYLNNVSYNPDTEGVDVDLPIPVYIDYQITTYARQPRHDREILAQLLTTKFPMRFGYLEIPEKSVTVGDTTTNSITLRRLDVLNVAKRDVTEQAKRLFVNAISVRVSSEIVQGVFRKFNKVSTVELNKPSDLVDWPITPDQTPVGHDTITVLDVTP